jgi:hypothetical protein
MATIRNLIIHGQFNASGVTAGFRQAGASVSSFLKPLESLHGSAAIGISELSRGIARVAQSGTVGAFAMREFTGAAFRLASFLGPVGPLIPIIGILGYALYEIFHKSRDEIDKTQQKFEQSLKEMVDNADMAALTKKFRDVFAGTASTGFTEGVTGLRNRLAAEEATLETLRQQRQGNDIKRAKELKEAFTAQVVVVNQLQQQLDMAEVTAARLRNEVIRPDNAPFENRPAPAVKITTDTFAASTRKLAQESERLSSIYDTLNKQHHATVSNAEAVLDAYDRLSARLRELRAQGRNAFDPLVEATEKAKATLEKSGLIQIFRLGQIPTAPAPAVTPSIPQGPLPGRNLSVPFGIRPDEFANDVGMQMAEAIRESLTDILSRGAIQPAVLPPQQQIGRLDVLKAQFTDFFSDVGTTITGELVAAFGPIAILMRALQPAIAALTPLFDRLAVPIALVARVLVASIEPILRALFPILRAFGIVAAFLGEVMARVSAAIAQAVGGLVKAIGNLIAKIPGLGGVGHAIANFGQSILNFAEGQKQAADEFARTRKELQSMTWDGTAQALENLQNSANGASDALTNIPNTLKINRAIFLATNPVNPQSVTGGAAGGGQSNYFAPGSIVIVGSK